MGGSVFKFVLVQGALSIIKMTSGHILKNHASLIKWLIKLTCLDPCR